MKIRIKLRKTRECNTTAAVNNGMLERVFKRNSLSDR
jgi:hypothetical protein